MQGEMLRIVCCYPQESSDPESEFHFKNLVYTVVSLLLAGTESSSNTLLHGFVLLLKNPDVVGELGIGGQRPERAEGLAAILEGGRVMGEDRSLRSAKIHPWRDW